jgi:hypothetical protein
MRDTPRKDFDELVKRDLEAGAFEVADVVTAGSPRCHEVAGVRESYTCRRCGAFITTIYMTTHGPLGGDCLATLTGDSSSRSRIQSLTRKLHPIIIGEHARFRLSLGEDKKTRVERVFPGDWTRLVAIHAGPIAEVLCVIERVAGALGYEPYVSDDGAARMVNARYWWIGGNRA